MIDQCPNCESKNLVEEVKKQEFLYVDGVNSPQVTLRARMPVMTCRDCGYATTDYRGEEARAKAVEQHIECEAMLNSIPEPYRSAHLEGGPGNDHKARVLASVLVGCYYCLEIYPPAEIEEWTADQCALCPKCGIDSVLPEANGPYAADFLKWMQHYWFEQTVQME